MKTDAGLVCIRAKNLALILATIPEDERPWLVCPATDTRYLQVFSIDDDGRMLGKPMLIDLVEERLI